jgi:hypothetical protein
MDNDLDTWSKEELIEEIQWLRRQVNYASLGERMAMARCNEAERKLQAVVEALGHE